MTNGYVQEKYSSNDCVYVIQGRSVMGKVLLGGIEKLDTEIKLLGNSGTTYFHVNSFSGFTGSRRQFCNFK